MDGVDTTVFDDLVDDDDDDDDAVRRAPTSLDLPPVVAPPPPPPRTSLNEERPNTDRVASPMNKLLAGALHTRLQSVPSLPKPSMAQRPATFNAPASEHVAQISTDGKLTILVDSRELKTPICSLLRNKYQLNTVVRQLAVADYIVSNRVGVERKARSDLLKSVYNKRLHEQITSLTVMYEIPVLIIEDEPVPLGGGGMRGMQTENAYDMMVLWCPRLPDNPSFRHHRNKQSQFEGVVASLMRYDRLRVLQSKDKAETAKLLSDLAQMELQQGAKILVPTLIPEKKHQVHGRGRVL